MKKNSRAGNITKFLVFAGPSLFCLITVMFIPFIYGIFLTFTNYDGVSASQSFVGLKNYMVVFGDNAFWQQLVFTLKYVFLVVLCCNILALLLATILTSGVIGEKVFRAGFFVPNLMGGIILGYLWQFLFANVFTYIGKTFRIGILSTSWLNDPDRALWAMVIVTAWQLSGYLMVIYIAGLMNVPKELKEAASLDGAGGFYRFRQVTLPMLTPSVVICVFLAIQKGFMAFDVNLSLTQGGPYGSTRLVSLHVYETAFRSQRFGSGQAEAIILFLIVAGIAVAQVYFTKKKEVEA